MGGTFGSLGLTSISDYILDMVCWFVLGPLFLSPLSSLVNRKGYDSCNSVVVVLVTMGLFAVT